MKDKKPVSERDTKAFRTLFLILVPSLLLAIPFPMGLNYQGMLVIVTKCLLLLLQFVIVKSVLDEYYKYQ